LRILTFDTKPDDVTEECGYCGIVSIAEPDTDIIGWKKTVGLQPSVAATGNIYKIAKIKQGLKS
jgi:hypothetical protein